LQGPRNAREEGREIESKWEGRERIKRKGERDRGRESEREREGVKERVDSP